MEKDIPKVSYSKSSDLHIEVMTFNELCLKLENSKNHNPYHTHQIQFYLILIVTQGTYAHFVDFKPYQLIKGSALFVAKTQVHHFTESLQTCDGICVVFNHLFVYENFVSSNNLKLNRLFNYHIETPIIHEKDLKADSFTSISKKLYQEYNRPDDFAKSDMLQAILLVLFIKAERSKQVQSLSGVKSYWLETFNAFKTLIENNYTTSRSSRYYASQLHITYKFLNDIVKKIAGKTAKAFIDDFVIMEIKRQLVSTALSIKEISYNTGFEEPSNMVKFFKQHTQTTPLKFRQQL